MGTPPNFTSKSASIPDDLEEIVRQKAIKEFGIKKGDLSMTVIKALETWVKE